MFLVIKIMGEHFDAEKNYKEFFEILKGKLEN